MRKQFILLAGMGFALSAAAQHLGYNQYELLQSGGPRSVAAKVDQQYDEIKGDAFFSPQWQSAAAVTAQRKRYSDLKCKFDLYKNTLYLNVHDTIYDLSGAVQQFVLYSGGADSAVFQNGFSTGGLQPDKYLQVLAAGKLTLLKQRVLEIKDVHDESPLTTTKKFVGQDYYYIVRADGQAQMVKPGRKFFETEMGDKWKSVSQAAREKGWSTGDEEGWGKIVQYYNGL